MRSLENTLALWISGILTSNEVVAWAEKEVARLDQPPSELVDVMLEGPEKCLKKAQTDFPLRPSRLAYSEAFAVRAVALNLESARALEQFARWAAIECMGEDLSNPFVTLGYQLDHLLNDCDEPGTAKALVRTELPALLPLCKPIALPYLEAEA